MANKWDNEVEFNGEKMTAEAVAVAMYNKGEGKTVDEIAEFLGEEFHGSKNKGQKVIAKLTSLKLYEKPEAPKKADRVPQVRKADLVKNIETKMRETVEDYELGSIGVVGKISDLTRLAEFVGADMPEPR